MLEFLAYSDIHHDTYTNGLTLDDIVSVEDEITKYAIEHNIKHVVFGGDWYRATNPTRKVIASAEASWKRRSDAGIKTLVVVGNHDRWTKSASSGHAFIAASIFSKDLEEVYVYDSPIVVDVEGIKFLMIPTGHEGFDFSDIGDVNVVVYHGMIAGSVFANNIKSQEGQNPDFFKNFHPSLLICGDNHTPQQLNEYFDFPAMYLGAPMQHTWGDKNQVRGFWHFKITGKNLSYDFIPSYSPRFVKLKLEAKNEMQAIINLSQELEKALQGRPGIIEVTLIGSEAESVQKYLQDNVKNLNIRDARIIIDRSFEIIEVAKGINQAKQPEDKWKTYVISGVAPSMDGLNPEVLSDMGSWALAEAAKL